ncbi:hypothetical protein Vretimale_12563 [Volvox reticuliferus]|uniref:Uncharacterized protein n=1 Tax=Volvox reticuliferus TaxID=1737510 RepID=A0A8J4LT65_9CHLO|nr:hypothetical protein Vretifemale_9181 [Volvox reticuliferus]GIM08546.1 hypothetical protein Vretimale_12563 [Volvox reticuliferus]
MGQAAYPMSVCMPHLQRLLDTANTSQTVLRNDNAVAVAARWAAAPVLEPALVALAVLAGKLQELRILEAFPLCNLSRLLRAQKAFRQKMRRSRIRLRCFRFHPPLVDNITKGRRNRSQRTAIHWAPCVCLLLQPPAHQPNPHLSLTGEGSGLHKGLRERTG